MPFFVIVCVFYQMKAPCYTCKDKKDKITVKKEKDWTVYFLLLPSDLHVLHIVGLLSSELTNCCVSSLFFLRDSSLWGVLSQSSSNIVSIAHCGAKEAILRNERDFVLSLKTGMCYDVKDYADQGDCPCSF